MARAWSCTEGHIPASQDAGARALGRGETAKLTTRRATAGSNWSCRVFSINRLTILKTFNMSTRRNVNEEPAVAPVQL